MAYSIDCSSFTLLQSEQRILGTDLVPSLAFLKNDIHEVMEKFSAGGIANLADLRALWKNKKALQASALRFSLDEEYLNLLRREIEGWPGKIRSIDEFEWLEDEERAVLQKTGLSDSEKIFMTLQSPEQRKKISTETHLFEYQLEELWRISDLLRVRWLSPNFARLIHSLGYTPYTLRTADASLLTSQIDSANKDQIFYKGKIGERDIRRMIFEAGFVL